MKGAELLQILNQNAITEIWNKKIRNQTYDMGKGTTFAWPRDRKVWGNLNKIVHYLN